MISAARLADINRDEIRTITNVSWDEYEYFLKHRESKARISYLDGVIQFVSPGYSHEKIKEIIGVLIVAYCEQFNIDYYPMGSTTLKQKDKSAGKEPDTSYSFNAEKEIPDLAIEVIFSSGNPDSDLEKYRRLGVKEVWFWINNKLQAYSLISEKCTKLKDFSLVLPELNLSLIDKYIRQGISQSPLQTKKDFLREI